MYQGVTENLTMTTFIDADAGFSNFYDFESEFYIIRSSRRPQERIADKRIIK